MPQAQEKPPDKSRAARIALIGLGLIIGGFVLASTSELIFPGQDPAGKAMAAGLIFFAGLLSGIVALVAAGVMAIANRRKQT